MISSRKITDLRKGAGGGGGFTLEGKAQLPEPHLVRLAAADCTLQRDSLPGGAGMTLPLFGWGKEVCGLSAKREPRWSEGEEKSPSSNPPLPEPPHCPGSTYDGGDSGKSISGPLT